MKTKQVVKQVQNRSKNEAILQPFWKRQTRFNAVLNALSDRRFDETLISQSNNLLNNEKGQFLQMFQLGPKQIMSIFVT